MTPDGPGMLPGALGCLAPTATQAALQDRVAIEHRGVPGSVLMENAGRQAAQLIHHLYPEGPVLALVGPGNNGGDALVCLRSLISWGRSAVGLIVGDRGAPPSILHGWEPPLVRWQEPGDLAATLHERGIHAIGVLVDGLLGTGIRGAPRPPFAAAIAEANVLGVPIVAMDAPSGVDGDSGRVEGAAIRADLTVAFGWPKLGTLLGPGRTRAGRIVAVEIGFPPPAADESGWARLATPAWASRHLPRRATATHKNAVGALTLVAGSTMPGAAILAARAAFRCGAGLVRLCAGDAARDLLGEIPELIHVDASDSDALRIAVRSGRAIAVGPGLGTDAAAARQIRTVLEAREDRPLVLDADALSLIARDDCRALPADDRIALTPHPGEMARLLATSVAQVEEDRVGAATNLARTCGVVVLLKGTPSLVADPGGGLLVSATEAASDLAVAGMGDILTGAVGAFLAQGVAAHRACGLALHTTGRAAAEAGLGASLMPSDLIAGLPAALATAVPVTTLPFPFVTLDQAPPR